MTIKYPKITLSEAQERIVNHLDGPLLVSAGPGSGKCLTGDAMIATSEGMIKIEDCEHINDAACLDLTRLERTTSHDAKWFDMGEKQTIKIRTDSGIELSGTPEHPLLVWDGDFTWKRLENMKPGDHVLLYPGHSYDNNTCDHNDCEKAYLFGLLIGDAYTNKRSYTIGFSRGGRHLPNVYYRLATKFFGKTPKEYRKKGTRSVTHQINSKQAWEWLEQHDYPLGCRAGKKYIPSWVLKSPAYVQTWFLRGYFDTDGSVSPVRHVELVSASETLARQTQQLLIGLGVVPILCEKYVDGYEQSYWRLSISGDQARVFHDRVSFSNEADKQANLVKLISKKSNPNKGVYPHTSDLLYKIKSEWKSRMCWDGRKQEYIHSDGRRIGVKRYLHGVRKPSQEMLYTMCTGIDSVEAQKLTLLSSLYPDEIVSVENGPVKRVYDLTIPVHHNFIANGIVSHNTRVIVERIKHMLDAGIRPDNILATTFTRKAADEMNSRLKAMNVNTSRIAVQTMHALCWRMIRNHKTFKGFKIDDKDIGRIVLKQILGYKQMNWQGVDISQVEMFISSARNSLVSPENSAGFMSPAFRDPRYAQAYKTYVDQMEERRLITFDDMLYYGVWILENDPTTCSRMQGKYLYVMVDEFQDSNFAQLRLAELIATPEFNYVAVGDTDQCQPAGTMIDTPIGKRPIETFSNGDIVKVWNRHAGRIVGTQPVNVGSRRYDGPMHTICTKDFSTQSTSNHKFFVRWNRKFERWVVYMMYREDRGYRIGWCKLFTNRIRTYHLGQRTRLEDADMAWILKVFDNPKDASIYESIASTKWRVPTAIFKPNEAATYYDEEGLTQIFASADIHDARKCLADHGLDFQLPLYIKNKMPVDGRQRGTIFITAACNIIPSLMSVPTKNEWQPVVENVHHRYKGTVYSFDVPEHKSYVADDIVTHNCLYSWRGALPEFMLEFAEKYGAEIVELGVNYRCAPAILKAASSCIVNNKNRLDKEFRANRTTEAYIRFLQASDTDEEALMVREEIQAIKADGVGYGSMRVLYRCNAQSRAIEEEFVRAKIPFVVLGAISFYERKEIADLLSYLRLLYDPRDVRAGERAINRPFRFVSRRVLDDITHRSNHTGSYIDAATQVLQHTHLNSACDWAEMMREFNVEEDTPADVLRKVVQDTDYIDYLMDAEGTDTPETSRAGNIGELIASATRFNTIPEYVEYIDTQIKLRKRNQRKQEDSRVQVMTIHKAKGTEANMVFLIGANEGIIPHAKGDTEEERRLFYVAVTRAKDRLVVSVTSGQGIGTTANKCQPSRFVYEAGIVSHDDNLTMSTEDDMVGTSSEGHHEHTENVSDKLVESVHRRDNN